MAPASTSASACLASIWASALKPRSTSPSTIRHSQTIGFKFRAFGATINAGSVTLSVPICTIDELRSVFEQFADIIKDFFRNKLVAGLETAVAWLRDNLTLAVSEAGQLLRSAGVAMAEAAKALVNVMGAAVKDAALAVARTLDEAVSLLRDTFGLPAQEIADFANSVGNVFTSGIGSVGSMFSGGSNSLYVPPGGFTVIKDYYHGNHQWLFDSPGSGAILLFRPQCASGKGRLLAHSNAQRSYVRARNWHGGRFKDLILCARHVAAQESRADRGGMTTTGD